MVRQKCSGIRRSYLARLLKDNNPAIFDEIVTNKGKAQPSLTYNGDRLATEH